jgi:hypothetical protein
VVGTTQIAGTYTHAAGAVEVESPGRHSVSTGRPPGGVMPGTEVSYLAPAQVSRRLGLWCSALVALGVSLLLSAVLSRAL